MKIVCVADTHNQHEKLTIPKCDVFIHAGDMFCSREPNVNELINFNSWLGNVPAKHKLIVAGNHDAIFAKEKKKAIELLTNGVYLEDSAYIIDNIKFYGTPYHLVDDSWFFGKEREKELKCIYEKIPINTNILITHAPPFGILDLKYNARHAGSRVLRNLILTENSHSNLFCHIFGHVHEFNNSVEIHRGIKFINCSITGVGNKWLNHKPFEFIMEEL